MKIATTRFGDISIDESRIVEMREGMLGFEHLKRYVLLTQEKETPFLWFQSVDDGSLAFVVIHAFMAMPDYEPVISDEDARLLEIASTGPEDVVVLSVVTIRSDPFKVTANLRAPIVINAKKRLAKQIVLPEGDYPVQYSLTENATNIEGKKNDKIPSVPAP
ncbi:MAG: flagellar assembly protein FliW [Deltaproteobacteria bacterium]|nr:flagellar assembly protein FliW [Deltaproteobacteria bacterium]